MSKKYTAAFNLLELMVVMAIAAVIFLLAFYALMILQRSGRDQDRKSVLAEISAEINDYRVSFLKLPDSLDIDFVDDKVLIEDAPVYELEGHLRADTETSNSKTKYYYNRTSGGFQLCADLESGGIASGGTVDCPESLP